MPQVGILFVFVKEVKKNHAAIADFAAGSAVFSQLLPFFPALFAEMVDNPVIPPTDIFFKPPVVRTVHAAVGIARRFQQPVDHLKNTLVPGRVTFFNLVELFDKMIGEMRIVSAHKPGSDLFGS